jgi:hypothetical protein
MLKNNYLGQKLYCIQKVIFLQKKNKCVAFYLFY